MSNGNSHDRLAERCEQFERRVEDRSARRDAEFKEAREAILDNAARLGANESAVAELKAAVATLQSVKPPGVLALAGPAIAASVVVGSLGSFVLGQAIGPLKENIVDLKEEIHHVQADMTGAIRMLMERQDDVRQRLSRIEGQLPEMDRRIEDVDQFGSRKWVGKEK